MSSLSLGNSIPEKGALETNVTNQNPIYIRLLENTFDPLQEEIDIHPNLKVQNSQDYYIVQFNGPIHDDWRKNLDELGTKVLRYIPDFAYLVKMNDDIKKAVETLPNIRWIGLYHPGYKVQPGLLEKKGVIELNVVVFRDDYFNLFKVRNRIMTLGGTINYHGNDNYIVRAEIEASKIKDIAFIPEVEWIDEYKPPILMMNNIREFTGGNTVHINGFNGSGIVGEVNDNGFDVNHPDLAGQIIGSDGTINDEAHGTCTFGIVFSTGANNVNATGLLPGGKGVISAYWDVTRTTSISNLVNNWGGVFQSNSWGGWPDSTYQPESQEDDQAVFDYDVVMLYAAGNYGITTETCSPDAVAKNTIGVGALNHYNNNIWTDDEWINQGWGLTPSQGPASDGRIKPDLSGPFDWIFTTDSVDGDGEDGYEIGNYYDDMGGTSGATPVAAGCVGLVYQMYKENHFGNNPTGILPHASTVKAILIADAYQYEFFQANRYQQGWGGVDIGNVYNIGDEHFIVDESDSLQTGGSVNYSISPTGTGPLKISLVWTDVPGTTSSAQHLINDLHLKATDPDGIVYWGNNGLTTSKWSSSGGSADTLNNVENVFIQNPKLGTWTLEVIGGNVPMDGDLSTPEIDQVFSLVASNVAEALRVDITNPNSFEFINDITNITGTASGDIIQVEVKIDGGFWQQAVGNFTWYYNWDTRSFSDGVHTIYARVFNGTVYSELDSVEVIVDNKPPTTSINIGDPKYYNGSLWFVDASTPFT